MTMQPFKIQSPTLSLNGVAIDTSAQGKLVIPGITRAGTSVAIEVNDTGDQSYSWGPDADPTTVTIIDGYQFAVLNGDLSAQVGWTAATYAADGIDGEGYIDGISVVTGGAGYTGEAVTYSQTMYATLTVDAINNFNASDWTQIPFSVRCGAGEITSEFGSGGGANIGHLIVSDNNNLYSDDSQNFVNFDNSGSMRLGTFGNDDLKLIANWDGNTQEWVFGASGGLTFPDGSTQFAAANPIVTNPLPYGVRINVQNGYVDTYNQSISVIDPTLMTDIGLPSNKDDNFVELTDMPFNLYFNGNTYDLIGVGSNSYVTFGDTTNNYDFGDDPTMDGAHLPGILISEADNSFQRVLTYSTGTSPGREYHVRYEGTNATEGTVGQSNIIWQMSFYESTPHLIDLLILSDERNIDGHSGMTNGNNWILYEDLGNGGLSPRTPWNSFNYSALEFPGSTVTKSGGKVSVTGVGSGSGSALTNGDYAFTLNSNGTITLPKGVSFNAPDHTESWQGGDFIQIQGATGYYNDYNVNSTRGGEGTSVGLYAGLGGESGDFVHGGKGGLLDFHAGNGQHGGQGGAVTIAAGAATWSGNVNVRGGDVNISAGDATDQNQVAAGHGTGGDLHLGAGRGNAQGGSVFIHTSDDHSGQNFTKLWEFDQYGETSAPGAISVGYNGAKVATLGTGPGGFSLIGESDKSFEIVVSTNDTPKQWIFGTDGSITFPDNSVQSTAYTGQGGGAGFGDIYIMANADGNIITSTDGITWGAPVPSGVPSAQQGPYGTVAIGKLEVHNGVIVYTRADIGSDTFDPMTGLYYSTVIGTATLCTGTDSLAGDDLFWNEVHYFTATATWVSVGYARPVSANQYPVLAHSTNGTDWTIVVPDSTFLSDYTGNSASGQFTDVIFNTVSNQYVISAVRTTQGPAYGGMFVTSDVTVPLTYANFVDIETNGYRLAYWPYAFFGAIGYVFVVDYKDDGTFGLWNGSVNGNNYAGLLDPNGWSDAYGWYEDTMVTNVGYVPSVADIAFNDNVFIITTVDGQVFVQPDAPVTNVTIPLAYTSPIHDIIRNPAGPGSPSVIQVTDGETPANDGEKIVISGVTSQTENGSTTEQSYNGTFYIKNNNGSFELYTDQALTQPWDTGTFWPVVQDTGTLTWSHGQFIDAAGVAGSILFVGNDDEQVFRSSDQGSTWTLERDVTGNYFNDFAFGTFGGGSYQLTNGNKHLTLETDGTVTPPVIDSVKTLDLNGNLSVARPKVGFAVTQGNNNSDTWATANDVDADGNIYVVGGFYDWDWDGDDRPTVIKYSPAGEKLWQCVFQYDYGNFGGTSYNIEYDPVNDQVIVVFTNWYQYHRTQVVTLDAADGSVIKSDEISTANNNYFSPRGFAIKDGGEWVIAGEAQNTVALTTGTKIGSVGSDYGILFLPQSYFSTWGHYPVGGDNWSIKTTWDSGNFSDDYIYYVNRYYSLPTFNLIGSGTNLAVDVEFDPQTGEVTYDNMTNSGTGYNPGDIAVIYGTSLGSAGYTTVIADTGSALSVDGGVSIITPTSANASWNDVALHAASGTWRAAVWVDGQTTTEATIASASFDIATNLVVITLDQDYSSSFNGSTGNIVVYDLAGNNVVFVISTVDSANGNFVTSYNRFGLVHSDTVKMDCENSTDFGTVFEQTFVSNPGNDGSLINIITTTKAGFPRWADVYTDGTWTVTDGTNTANIIGSSDYNDGYITWNLDGNVLGQGTTVTIRSTIQQYQPNYTTNNDAGIITSTGVELTWGTADRNQRFNVVEYGSDGSIYAAGYGDHPDIGDCSLLVKFDAAGTTSTWYTLFQGTDANQDYDIHGLEVTTESGTEYVYVITYDDDSNGMLYKINGDTGNIVWCSYVLGGATGTNIYWNRGAAIRIASNGDVVVAGIARENGNLYSNSSVMMVIRVSPVDGHLISAQEMLNNLGNNITTRYEGDESDFQFELHSTTANGVTTEYVVASVYTYNGNRDEAVTVKIPLSEPTMTFAQSIFNIYNVTADLASAVVTEVTDYRTTTYTDAVINHGSLTRTANKNLITNNGSPYWGTDLHAVIDVLGGTLGEVTGVKALTFEDGSTQTSAYSPLMGSVINNNYWYYAKSEDAGKFLYCDGNTYGVELPDDAARNLPVGWAITIIAPIGRDISLIPWYNNSPATIVVPGNDPQTNPTNYNGWTLKGGGMATVLKVASNTYYVSGGKLEAQ